MRDVATVIAMALLVTGGSAAAAVPDDPKAVAYEALSSLLLGNAVTFASVTLPVDGVQAILRASPPSVYVGLLGTIELPFRLRKVNGGWKVLPEPYFEWLRSMGAL